MADTSQTQLAYITETTYGTTPSTPAFTNVRYTSESLKAARQNVQSEEIRRDRNVPDLIQVGGNAAGGVNFELSYGAFDDFIESALFSAWSSDVIKNGVDQTSFTLEKIFENGATDQHFIFTGAVVNSMSLNIQAQQQVAGSFEFLCKSGSMTETAITGSTYTDAPTNDAMNAATDFASLSVTGATAPAITGLTLEISNNLRQKPVVGSLDSYGIGAGQCVVTGTITAYFENSDLMEQFLAGTATDLSFSIGGATENKYDIVIPRLKFSDGDVPTGGNNQDVIQTLQFTALYDPTEECAIKITRTPAA